MGWAVVADLSALSGQEGGDESAFGWRRPLRSSTTAVTSNGAARWVTTRPWPPVFEQEPAGRAGEARQSGGAGIEHADAPDEAIGDLVGMPSDDEVGGAVSEQGSKVAVGGIGVDAGAVVGLRRGVDAEKGRSVGQSAP
jgi:hypothetical protein